MLVKTKIFQAALEMKYLDGTEAQVGDILTVRGNGVDARGVILKIVRSNTKDAEDWSLPDDGVLIEGGGLGLFTTADLGEDEDIVFLRRKE
jgi:ribosomal protein L10